MSSFVLEDFIGNGELRDQIDSLIAVGWGDVPTLKVMTKEDMEILQLTQLQRDALEIRTYLHNRHLMKYADVLESSGKTLTELLSTSPTQLTTQYNMRRGHVARFMDMGGACAVKVPSDLVLPARKLSAAHHNSSSLNQMEQPEPQPPVNPNSSSIRNATSFTSNDDFKAPVLLKGPSSDMMIPAAPVSRGIFFSSICGAASVWISATRCDVRGGDADFCFGEDHGPAIDAAAWQGRQSLQRQEISSLGRSIQGRQPLVREAHAHPVPAPSRLCDVSREAHQLYTRKPIFDAIGIQLVVCLNENIDSEVRAFWPRYWGGMVVVDEQKDYFKALGHGKPARENYLTGFFLNARARENFKRATAMGIQWNTKGHGTIKGASSSSGPDPAGWLISLWSAILAIGRRWMKFSKLALTSPRNNDVGLEAIYHHMKFMF